MQAIVLAGGFGTRLQSVVADVPKPMAPIGSKPFLSYLMDYLTQQGITRITLSVHHMHDKIEKFFGANYNNIPIHYAIEEKPLGTGGAIRNSLQLHQTDEPVFVINGDTFLQVNYRKMWQQHALHSPLMTIALHNIANTERYGAVQVKHQQIIGFAERGHATSGLINAGVYLLHPKIMANYDLPMAFSFEKDFLHKHLQEISPQHFVTNDYFIDIGIPEDYLKAITKVPELI